jgi:type II secretion system protein J
MKKFSAFTLIEVMISIFILSIMSVAALASFQQMIHAKEIQKKHEAVLTSLSFAYTTLSNDFSQQTDLIAPLTLTEREIIFDRVLRNDVDAEASDVVNILYTWEDGVLKRHLTLDEDITTQILLKKSRLLKWEWLIEDIWHDISVPIPAQKKARAFKLTFQDPTVGEITWIFAHP